jgi:hypothetical protein
LIGSYGSTGDGAAFLMAHGRMAGYVHLVEVCSFTRARGISAVLVQNTCECIGFSGIICYTRAKTMVIRETFHKCLIFGDILIK